MLMKVGAAKAAVLVASTAAAASRLRRWVRVMRESPSFLFDRIRGLRMGALLVVEAIFVGPDYPRHHSSSPIPSCHHSTMVEHAGRQRHAETNACRPAALKPRSG